MRVRVKLLLRINQTIGRWHEESLQTLLTIVRLSTPDDLLDLAFELRERKMREAK